MNWLTNSCKCITMTCREDEDSQSKNIIISYSEERRIVHPGFNIGTSMDTQIQDSSLDYSFPDTVTDTETEAETPDKDRSVRPMDIHNRTVR